MNCNILSLSSFFLSLIAWEEKDDLVEVKISRRLSSLVEPRDGYGLAPQEHSTLATQLVVILWSACDCSKK